MSNKMLQIILLFILIFLTVMWSQCISLTNEKEVKFSFFFQGNENMDRIHFYHDNLLEKGLYSKESSSSFKSAMTKYYSKNIMKYKNSNYYYLSVTDNKKYPYNPHSKHFLATDKTFSKGVFVIHSISDNDNDNFSSKNTQQFLCISLNNKDIKSILEKYLVIQPSFKNINFPCDKTLSNDDIFNCFNEKVYNYYNLHYNKNILDHQQTWSEIADNAKNSDLLTHQKNLMDYANHEDFYQTVKIGSDETFTLYAFLPRLGPQFKVGGKFKSNNLESGDLDFFAKNIEGEECIGSFNNMGFDAYTIISQIYKEVFLAFSYKNRRNWSSIYFKDESGVINTKFKLTKDVHNKLGISVNSNKIIVGDSNREQQQTGNSGFFFVFESKLISDFFKGFEYEIDLDNILVQNEMHVDLDFNNINVETKIKKQKEGRTSIFFPCKITPESTVVKTSTRKKRGNQKTKTTKIPKTPILNVQNEYNEEGFQVYQEHLRLAQNVVSEKLFAVNILDVEISKYRAKMKCVHGCIKKVVSVPSLNHYGGWYNKREYMCKGCNQMYVQKDFKIKNNYLE